MARNRPNPPEESSGGAPKWMVTFSDCMTLLLTFFVLLLTFSSFDDKAFRKMTTSLATAMPSISKMDTRERDAVVTMERIIYQPDRKKGSEMPTQDARKEGGMKEDVAFVAFDDKSVFLVQSDTMFLGRGAGLSPQGRTLLDDLDTVLGGAFNRVVISEHLQPTQSTQDALGYQRAWTLARYLSEKGQLSLDQFAIGTAPTLPWDNMPSKARELVGRRVVEISVLEPKVTQ